MLPRDGRGSQHCHPGSLGGDHGDISRAGMFVCRFRSVIKCDDTHASRVFCQVAIYVFVVRKEASCRQKIVFPHRIFQEAPPPRSCLGALHNLACTRDASSEEPGGKERRVERKPPTVLRISSASGPTSRLDCCTRSQHAGVGHDGQERRMAGLPRQEVPTEPAAACKGV